jgi:hypothetical protein
MAFSIPVVIRAAEGLPNTPLGKAMNEIGVWLDRQKIEPVDFKTVVSHAGLGFEISFRHEHEAERFQQRFGALVGEVASI